MWSTTWIYADRNISGEYTKIYNIYYRIKRRRKRGEQNKDKGKNVEKYTRNIGDNTNNKFLDSNISKKSNIENSRTNNSIYRRIIDIYDIGLEFLGIDKYNSICRSNSNIVYICNNDSKNTK